MSRKVTIYSTAGKRAEVLENVNADNWKDLKGVLREMGVSYDGMKAVIGESRVTLESDKATLPETEFSLFLMPVKTKSGADRKALMDAYKANDAAQKHFKAAGLQITRMKTDDIEKAMANFGGDAVTAKVETPAAPATAASIVGSVAQNAAKKVGAAIKAETIDYAALIAAKKAEIDTAVKAGNYSVLGSLGAEVTQLEADQKFAEAEQKKLEKAQKEEAERAQKDQKHKLVDDLDKKAHNIAKDFNDLKSF